MPPSEEFVHTNYRMATARIGIALVLLPLLWGLAVLLYRDSPGNVWLSVLLGLLGLPFVWYALTVPTSVRIGEEFTVHYPLRQRVVRSSDVPPARIHISRRNFTLSQMLTTIHLPAARIPMAEFQIPPGRTIRVRATLHEVEEINRQLKRSAEA